mmetsp:Transcript_294/g.539  ORF Transcript_294/g.539 Transcript_294/m.539 type:complete len:94 (-) Transcript_294:198-479(-)
MSAKNEAYFIRVSQLVLAIRAFRKVSCGASKSCAIVSATFAEKPWELSRVLLELDYDQLNVAVDFFQRAEAAVGGEAIDEGVDTRVVQKRREM